MNNIQSLFIQALAITLVSASPPNLMLSMTSSSLAFITDFHVGKLCLRLLKAIKEFLSVVFWDNIVRTRLSNMLLLLFSYSFLPCSSESTFTTNSHSSGYGRCRECLNKLKVNTDVPSESTHYLADNEISFVSRKESAAIYFKTYRETH